MLKNVGIFPREEVGLYANLVKRFHFLMISKGEYVFKTGETAEEIYFVIEGRIVIVNEDEDKLYARLKKNDFFGEMAIINGQTSIRTVNKYSPIKFSLEISKSSDKLYLSCSQPA